MKILNLFLIGLAFASSDLKMVMISEGDFYLGRSRSMRQDETPKVKVHMSSFHIDETLVTFAAFRKFVEETHYVTTAEKTGYGMVSIEGMKNWQWKTVKGANWRQPFGKKYSQQIPIHNDYPVVSVSWSDADAYCKHYGKRLPTEAEWEYAMRAGREGTRFPWGDNVKSEGGKYLFNNWQGIGHEKNENLDGYKYMSPVKSFPANAWGVYDPVGNVWQWTADWYDSDYRTRLSAQKDVRDPIGPETGLQKVARGGSWWCSESTCDGAGLYRRGKQNPAAVFPNNGFRCAK